MGPLEAGDPRQVGVYRLRFRLGSGGMGRVFLGFSPAGRAVAVKIVHPDLARDHEFVQRFRREVRAAEAVSGAYTAPVVAAGPDDDPPWLATGFVAGPSLAEVVGQTGPLPEVAAWRLAGGLIEALQAVHARGLVHRDLKPTNILLAADGPRVIDFGISRALEGTAVTGTSMIVGTPGFMSPEQAQGLAVGPPSDVFALGSVIAYAATGRAPFGNGEPVAMAYRVVHAEPGLGGIPASLTDLVARCLAKAPADRPSLARLMHAITAWSALSPGDFPASFWPEPLAGLISSYQDGFRVQLAARAETGSVAAMSSLPYEPTAPATPGSSDDQPDATRTAYGRSGNGAIPRIGRPRTTEALTAAPHTTRRVGRLARRGPILVSVAALAVVALAATAIAIVLASQTPTRSPSRGTASTPLAHVTGSPKATPLTTATVCTYPAITCTISGGGTNMKTEPGQIVTSADGSGYVKDITWSGWGTATTTGTGTLEIDNCTPNCASGTYTGYPATITLSGLRPYGHREAYSEMVVTAPTAPDGDGDLSYHTGLVP